MSKRLIQTLIIFILIVVAIGFAAIIMRHHTKTKVAQVKLPPAVTIDTSNQPTIGNPKSKIHIVAFEDLKCMNCKRYSTEIFPKIKKAYIDTNKAQYTFFNLAFLPGSSIAATTARCLYDQKDQYFFAFTDYVYHHQGLESNNWITIPTMLDYASKIKGVDQKKLADCVIKSPYEQQLKNNLKIASKIMGDVVATPTVYINGIKVNPLSFDQFKKIYNLVSQKNG